VRAKILSPQRPERKFVGRQRNPITGHRFVELIGRPLADIAAIAQPTHPLNAPATSARFKVHDDPAAERRQQKQLIPSQRLPDIRSN